MKKLLIILAFLITGCYYDSEEELYGINTPCDTSSVTYSVTVTGLLNHYGCLGCHSGSSPSGNVSLQGYNNVKLVADNGKLFGAISHSAGFSPMPQGGNKMSQCDINKIKAWIDGGSLNN